MKFSSSHISYFLNDDMSVILLSTHILSQMRAIWQNVCVELLLFSFWWWMQNGYGGKEFLLCTTWGPPVLPNASPP